MYFSDLRHAKNLLLETVVREEKIPPGSVRIIASPYRICPLGAHIDHQGGTVLGMSINACTLMAFAPSTDGQVRLRSRNYPGQVSFSLDHIPEATGSFWGVYPRAAALALQQEHPLKTGITGLLDGMLPGCGLSSSASVLLAYLVALADVNDIELQPWEAVQLTRSAENRHIGLNNGILDQASIVFGRRNRLLQIDTRNEKVQERPARSGAAAYRILVAYSGYSRELTTTGYNSRVQECREAAAELSRLAGTAPAAILSDVSEDTYFRHGHRLAPHLARRARHYFTEVRRVNDGLVAWREDRMEDFGQLMFESCRSSIEQYECGSPPIHDLQQIVASADGVIGSRFSGGGFGGCVVGFVRANIAELTAADIGEAYRKLHPEVAAQSAVYLARSDDGVRLL